MNAKINGFLYRFYILLSAFSLFVILFTVKNVLPETPKTSDYLIGASLILVGLPTGAVLFSLFHEGGHILGVKADKGFIIEYCISGFTRRYDGEKFRFGFSFKNFCQGYVSFVSKDYKKVGATYYKSLNFALFCSLLCSALVALLFVFSKNVYTYSLFGGMTVASLYMTAINFLVFFPTSDGGELFLKKKYQKATFCGLEIQSRLFYGESLAEMPGELFELQTVEKNIGYYKYLRLLETCNKKTAFNYLDEVLSYYKKSGEQASQVPIEFEIEDFYRDVLNGDDEKILAKQEEMVSICELNESPLTLRVMSAYRLYLGDSTWHMVLKNRLQGMTTFQLVGLLKTEKAIADKYSAE
ncbi:MAG: hypothetical protein ACI4M6_04265 [Christensenellaceae bacterium]